jgi:hypothetical protein
MWAYGHNFRTEDVDDGQMAQECGVEVEFDQYSCASHHDQNTMNGKFDYVEKIQEIIESSSLLSNVLFLGASGGKPLIIIM